MALAVFDVGNHENCQPNSGVARAAAFDHLNATTFGLFAVR